MVKTCFFVSYSLVGPVHASLLAIEPQVIERGILWEAAIKTGVPDMCTSSCQRDTGDLE